MNKLLFLPYALLFSHRGISHAPVIGTLTRLAYLAPVWVMLWRIGAEWQGEMGWVIVGLMLSDMAHLVRDKLTKSA